MHHGKGGQGSKDPQYLSPHTIILDQAFVEYWQDIAEKECHPSRGTRQRPTTHGLRNRDTASGAHQAAQEILEEDKVEHGLPSPNSMYHACGQSFIAADGNHVKASTRMFGDTGVMAMVCPHNIPLFIVNMWTAGEKRFYALALLSAFLQHIPSSWKVSVLYDTGCQMDCALKKWDFALEWQT
jgi:hypothetical protein